MVFFPFFNYVSLSQANCFFQHNLIQFNLKHKAVPGTDGRSPLQRAVQPGPLGFHLALLCFVLECWSLQFFVAHEIQVL